jgi:hypothetical protein
VTGPRTAPSIWWWAFGYFACYVPYAALTKALTSGLIDAGGTPVGGTEILPPSVIAAVFTLVVFLLATGWWRKARTVEIAGWKVPRPGNLQILSGLCSSGIITTTTLAYTFEGVSIVFVMLLMRGGVLIMAPLVDRFSGRHVRWFSWCGLALSLSSLVVAFWFDPKRGGDLTLLCAIDVGLYLCFYFVRLSLMSRLAKSKEPGTNLRYFVEEGMVSAPALLVLLGLGALFMGGDAGEQLRAGFTTFWDRPVVLHALAVGALSQGTGICGGLIFLDTRENTFCVPVNRASSVLAGLVSSYWLMWAYDYRRVQDNELWGATLIIGAIGFLTIPPMIQKQRAKSRAAAAAAALS